MNEQSTDNDADENWKRKEGDKERDIDGYMIFLDCRCEVLKVESR